MRRARRYRDGEASRLRLPRMRRFGDPPRPVAPIQKISRVVRWHVGEGAARDVLLSLPRVVWLERPIPGERP